MDIGSGPNGLFENSDWFKVYVNAEGHLYENWPGEEEIVRYGYNSPDGASDIRVDCVFFADWYTPLAEPAEYGFGFQGRFVDFTAEGQGYTPDMFVWLPPCPPNGHEGTCEGTLYGFSGCTGGHWSSYYQEDVTETWDSEGWALYEFYRGTSGAPKYNKEKFAEGTRYWHPEWPYWALHQPSEGGGFPFLATDFVDKDLPAP